MRRTALRIGRAGSPARRRVGRGPLPRLALQWRCRLAQQRAAAKPIHTLHQTPPVGSSVRTKQRTGRKRPRCWWVDTVQHLAGCLSSRSSGPQPASGCWAHWPTADRSRGPTGPGHRLHAAAPRPPSQALVPCCLPAFTPQRWCARVDASEWPHSRRGRAEPQPKRGSDANEPVSDHGAAPPPDARPCLATPDCGERLVEPATTSVVVRRSFCAWRSREGRGGDETTDCGDLRGAGGTGWHRQEVL
jgi:hypothetical protein